MARDHLRDTSQHSSHTPELALENLALRQQLAVWKARRPRPQLTEMDRMFWALLSRLWTSWRQSLHVVRPETVVGWHCQGFQTATGHGRVDAEAVGP
jgi:hypothetical protein